MTGRRLKLLTKIAKTLGNRGHHNLDFEIVVGSKKMAQQAITLNRVEEQLPSVADIGQARFPFHVFRSSLTKLLSNENL